MNKTKTIKIRVTDSELKKIKEKAKKSKMNMSTYLLSQGLQKEIVVIEGLKEFTITLSRIGNNINQMTRLVHENRINNVDKNILTKLESELKSILQSLSLLITKKKNKWS